MREHAPCHPEADSSRQWTGHRLFARLLLIVVIAVSQGLIWWTSLSGALQNVIGNAPATIAVSVRGQQEFGTSSVTIGDRSAMGCDAASDMLARCLAESLAKDVLPDITLHVSGGVRQGELESLRRAILLGTEGRRVTILVDPNDDAAAVEVDFPTVVPMSGTRPAQEHAKGEQDT